MIDVVRIDRTEQSLSVGLTNIYVDQDKEGYLRVNGEVVAVGKGPQTDFDVVVTAYDAQGRILITEDRLIRIEGFVGFDPFSFLLEAPKVSKVRIHVRPNL
jgi:hypothetical protein